MSDPDYSDVKYLRDVKQPFFFGPQLGYLTLPPVFIADFDWYTDAYPSLDRDNDHFLARFPNGPLICYFETTYSVAQLHSLNWTMSASQYAPDGSVIMPPGWVAFGTAYDDAGRVELMVNLDEAMEDYGQISVWPLAYDPIGTGSNARGLGYAAESFRALVESLVPEDAL